MIPMNSKRISDILWPAGTPHRLSVWAILDGARNEKIYAAVQGAALQKCCLYAGQVPPELEVVAPYLVRLEKDNAFTNLVLENGWGDAWGVFFRSGSELQKLRQHLSEFLRVRDESGRRMMFRYYDPRVLRIYLPTCSPGELKTFFGPINHYVMEAADATTVLEFGFDGRQLMQKRIHLIQAASAATGG